MGVMHAVACHTAVYVPYHSIHHQCSVHDIYYVYMISCSYSYYSLLYCIMQVGVMVNLTSQSCGDIQLNVPTCPGEMEPFKDDHQ